MFFHLQHWERIFNGFGHITSGITQELICDRGVRRDRRGVLRAALASPTTAAQLPKWMAWVAIAISVVLAAVCAHCYMMPARPAWDSVLEVLSIVGARLACSARLPARWCSPPRARTPTRAAACRPWPAPPIGAVCTAAYAAFIQHERRRVLPGGLLLRPDAPHQGRGRRRRDRRRRRRRCCGWAPWSWARSCRWSCCVLARKKGDAASWKLFGIRGRGLRPSSARSACASPSTTWACPCSCSTRALPRVRPDRLVRPPMAARVDTLAGLRPANLPASPSAIPLRRRGGGRPVSAAPIGQPADNRIFSSGLFRLETPFPQTPLAKRDVSKRKGPPCVQGRGRLTGADSYASTFPSSQSSA